METTINNPFTYRGLITQPADVFDRDYERKYLQLYLEQSRCCQLVGERGVGRSSLLYNLRAFAREWDSAFVVGYVDLKDPRCHTADGFLERVWAAWADTPPPASLAELEEGIDDWLKQGRRPVLCLDNFEELASRSREFGPYFFINLRSLANQGLTFVTASEKSLGQLVPPHYPTSPFFNLFAILSIGRFWEDDLEDFVNLSRPGVPPFTPEEKAAILNFARGKSLAPKPGGHPLALQVACFHTLEARRNGETLTTAMQGAAAEMKTLLPNGEWEPTTP